MSAENIITTQGYDEMVRIFSELKKEKEHWVKEKQVAAQLGDRSENAEYISAKENIRNIDRQLFRIDRILSEVTLADVKNRKQTGRVLFGSVVRLLKVVDEKAEEMEIQIVGTQELQYVQKVTGSLCISNISPLGRNLMGKEVGDSVMYNNIEYEVLEILS